MKPVIHQQKKPRPNHSPQQQLSPLSVLYLTCHTFGDTSTEKASNKDYAYYCKDDSQQIISRRWWRHVVNHFSNTFWWCDLLILRNNSRIYYHDSRKQNKSDYLSKTFKFQTFTDGNQKFNPRNNTQTQNKVRKRKLHKPAQPCSTEQHDLAELSYSLVLD